MNELNTHHKPAASDTSVIRWAPLLLILFLIALSPVGTAFYWAFTR